ncbi:MAG: ABC transporter permease [Microbacterium sp.]|uniref:ABC transporter permease n=1 Tax=Microbacterium sp. TaxID=51671 RepID=UPI0026276D13|nr:ABC transporter permease [Microbacterium sp.]MCX6501815.1 ABC transporter permease [Microbacterium sp.]
METPVTDLTPPTVDDAVAPADPRPRTRAESKAAHAASLSPDEQAAMRAKRENVGRLVAVFVMPLLILSMLIGGYLFAMHAPTPHDMPIAVAGDSQAVEGFVTALEDADPDAVDLDVLSSAALATERVTDGDAAGAVVIENGTATLYTAGAFGSSQASTVTKLVTPEVIEQGLTLQTEDLLPLPSTDTAGLGAIFMMSALLMAGYLPFSFVYSNSPELLRLRRAVPLLAGWAAIIAGLIALVTGPILDVVPGDVVLPLMGVAWLSVFAVGSVQLFLTRILGPMAALASMLLLMVLGVPSSGLSMSIHTMPPIYGFLQNFLPAPAIGQSLRSVLYLDGAGASLHILVLVIGALGGLLLTLTIDTVRHQRNPNRPQAALNMPALHSGKRPRSKGWRYGMLFALPFLMVTMMISVMLGAMHSTTPTDVPVAIVGPTEQAEQMADALTEQTDDVFAFTVMTDADEARDLVYDRELAGAFVLPSAESPTAVLISNGAAGTTTQQIVTRVFTAITAAQQLPMEAEDVSPLPAGDPNGTSLIYLAMGWVMGGFLIVVVSANAMPALRPLKRLLPVLAVWSLVGSAYVWIIAAPIVGAISGHFWPMFGAGALAIFCVSLFATLLERLLGMLALLPVIGILMFLGMPASGGTLPVYMLPDAFQRLHQILPMPAALEAIRSILYFGGDTVGAHLLVLGIWGIVSLVLVMIVDAIRPPRTAIEVVIPDAVSPSPAAADAVPPVDAERDATQKELVGV